MQLRAGQEDGRVMLLVQLPLNSLYIPLHSGLCLEASSFSQNDDSTHYYSLAVPPLTPSYLCLPAPPPLCQMGVLQHLVHKPTNAFSLLFTLISGLWTTGAWSYSGKLLHLRSWCLTSILLDTLFLPVFNSLLSKSSILSSLNTSPQIMRMYKLKIPSAAKMERKYKCSFSETCVKVVSSFQSNFWQENLAYISVLPVSLQSLSQAPTSQTPLEWGGQSCPNYQNRLEKFSLSLTHSFSGIWMCDLPILLWPFWCCPVLWKECVLW